MLIRSRWAFALSSVVALTACMWWGSVDADRPRLILAELRDREADHSGDCADWTSLDDADDESDRYVDDVYSLTGDMVGACNDFLQAGRIDQDGYDRMDEMRVRVRVSVDEHRARLDDVESVDSMHEECADHHVEMRNLLDETEAGLRTGGMMSGGMM